MLRGPKELARRGRLLALILARPEEAINGLTGLIDYLSHAHAVDPVSGTEAESRKGARMVGRRVRVPEYTSAKPQQ